MSESVTVQTVRPDGSEKAHHITSPEASRLEVILSGLLAATVPVMFSVRLSTARFNVSAADFVLAALLLVIIATRRRALTQAVEVLQPFLKALGLFLGWLAVVSLISVARYPLVGLRALDELFKYAVDSLWLLTCIMLFVNSRSQDVFFRVWCLVAATATIAAVVARVQAWPHPVRPTVTFQNPNALAHYLGASLGVAWWMFHTPRAGGARRGSRWWAWLAVAVVFVGVVATASRGGLLAALVTLAWVVVSGRQITGRQAVRLATLLYAAVLVMSLAAILFFTPPGQELLGAIVGNFHLHVVDDRLELWGDSWQLYKSSPWLGIGPGMFGFLRQEILGKTEHGVHNEYLTALVERGPIGLVALLHLLGSLAVLTWRGLQRSSLAVVGGAVLVQSAVHGFVSNILQMRIMWVGVAIILVAHWLSNREGPAQQS